MGCRNKIIRRPGGEEYPGLVCEVCGRYAAEKTGTGAHKVLTTRVLGDCEICKERIVPVYQLWEFGLPTFYTYAGGRFVE